MKDNGYHIEENVWYVKWNNTWYRVKWLAEQSALSDVFEFTQKQPFIFAKQAQTITMDYGCMGNLINKKELIKEEDFYHRWFDEMNKEQYEEKAAELLKNVPKKYHEKIKNRAWEYGHAFGYSEVYTYLMDLVDIFE